QPRWKQKIYASPGGTQGGIVGFLLRRGLAKDESQANIILLGVLIATVALIAWVLWPSASQPAPTNLPPRGTPGATQ
ncbi:MAG: hypothetical protein Q7S26_04005, partial [bacterium]|nr:hypothetical protein [bacterium]